MDPNTEKAFEQGADFLKMWTQLMSNMGAAGFSFTPGDAPPEAFKQVRSSLLDSMGKTFETYMRSPEFLESMKQQMDGAIAFKKQMNEWLTNANHKTQQPAREDVEQIDRRLRDIEQDVSSRIDAVESKLDAIICMLGKANGAGSSPRPTKKAARKTAKKPAKKKSA